MEMELVPVVAPVEKVSAASAPRVIVFVPGAAIHKHMCAVHLAPALHAPNVAP